jgi:hypothetical protein
MSVFRMDGLTAGAETTDSAFPADHPSRSGAASVSLNQEGRTIKPKTFGQCFDAVQLTVNV